MADRRLASQALGSPKWPHLPDLGNHTRFLSPGTSGRQGLRWEMCKGIHVKGFL